jgi:hypothetical protein
MTEAARRFMVPFIRARGYLPQNPSASRSEIRTALLEWENSREYISRETYEYIRAMLIDIDNLLEKQQITAAITKMEAIWVFMMTKAFGPPAKLPYIASPFPEGFPVEMKGSVPRSLQIPGPQELKSRFGSEFRNMIFEGEREGKEVGAMLCFPKDTLVKAVGIFGGLSRIYSGTVVEIDTERGFRLEATPEHPVLTWLGWKDAKDIKEGDTIYTWSEQNDEVDGRRIEDIVEEFGIAMEDATRVNPNSHSGWNSEENGKPWTYAKTITNFYPNEGSELGRDGSGIHSWVNRRRGYYKFLQKKEETLNPFDSNFELFNGVDGLVTETYQEYICHRKVQNERKLFIHNSRIRFLSTHSKTSSLFSDQAKTQQSPQVVYRKSIGKIPPRGLLGIRTSANSSAQMVESEAVSKVSFKKTENLRVYNLTTINGVYFANDILVHNCQSPSGELHLSRVCWGVKGKVHVSDCHDHLKPYGSFHVHLYGGGVFSPTDLEQAIDREQLSCIGYVKAEGPMLKSITPHKYYEYPPETRTKIRMTLNEATQGLDQLKGSDPNSPSARKLALEVQNKIRSVEQLLGVYEIQL